MVCAGAARDIIMVGVGADLEHHDRWYRIFDMTMDGAGAALGHGHGWFRRGMRHGHD